MSKFKPDRTVGDAITTIIHNMYRVAAKKADPKDADYLRADLRVILISESNELHIFEGMLSGWSMFGGVNLHHFNIKDLKATDIRGRTLAAVVISKRLWGAQISQARTTELHNALATTATDLGLDISDLVFYV